MGVFDLPAKPFFALALVLFANSVCITVLFPFVGFMIKDLGMTENVNEVGGL